MFHIILQTNAAEGAGSFFDSPLWKFASLMTKAVLVALWLALVFWTYKDAKRRINDPLMIAIAVGTSLVFPYVGTLFYTILRPPEYLEDVLERDLEIRARELEIDGGSDHCFGCRTPVRQDFLFCPNCRRPLKTSCSRCERLLEPSWRICPYCGINASGPAAAKSSSQTGRSKRKKIEEDELFA